MRQDDEGGRFASRRDTLKLSKIRGVFAADGVMFVVQVPGAARRAAAFRRMRDARSSEVAEDYVELVGDLIVEHGSARLTDLADCLGVAPATAAKALQRLQRDGLVETRPYRSITLTQAGETMAAASRERHRIVHEFLTALGVSGETAEADAEGIEHHVSPETLTLFERMTERLRNAG